MRKSAAPPWAAFFFALTLVCVSARADDAADWYAKALAAVSGKTPMADFWTARYLAVSAAPTTDALDALVKPRALAPAAFLPADFDPEFVDWFEKASWRLWLPKNPEHVREKYGTFEIGHTTLGRYYAAVVASPRIETWYVSAPFGEKSRRLVLATGSPKKKILLYSGLKMGGIASDFPAVEIPAHRRSLCHLWEPELSDLDGDGMPELWVRYDLAADNGFQQVLDVYRFAGDTGPELLKRFEGSVGLARRTGERTVEVARAVASRPELSRGEFDRHHFENWEWKGGKWTRVSERMTSHLYKSGEWKKHP